MVLTSHIGVAYASGLSKNKSWSDPDAVFPIMKHFAPPGSAQGGRNTAPFTDHGWREIMASMLIPFKAVYVSGGARGTMIAYNEIDGVPNAVNPILYKALADWGFDGFTIAWKQKDSDAQVGQQAPQCIKDRLSMGAQSLERIDRYYQTRLEVVGAIHRLQE